MKPPVFLDRDGVINDNRADYVKNPAEWIPLPGALFAVSELYRAGHPIVVVTNQSGVARGLYTVEAVEEIHDVMLSALRVAGAPDVHVFYCPHHPKDGCSCRKPEPGMVIEARKQLDLPPGGWIVGDAQTDMELGRRSGLKTVLVLTGRGEHQLKKMRAENCTAADYVTRSLVSAVGIIIST